MSKYMETVMVDEIAAFAVTKILGTMISDDRKHLLVHVGQSPGEPVWLSFPIEQAGNLAAAAAAGVAAVTPNVMNDGEKPCFEVRARQELTALSISFLGRIV
jgi:hypothetical protein